jgi:hypothetical protein
MRAVYGCFRMDRCGLQMAVTAETSLLTDRCGRPMAVTVETSLLTDRCGHPMAATAETLGWRKSLLNAKGYSGFPAILPEVGVWP